VVGLRLFILTLAGALVFRMSREWDWRLGSAPLQRTHDAYLHADLTPLAAKERATELREDYLR
jgi:hypothetical protein